ERSHEAIEEIQIRPSKRGRTTSRPITHHSPSMVSRIWLSSRRRRCVSRSTAMMTTLVIVSATLRFTMAFSPARIIQPVSCRTKPITYGASKKYSTESASDQEDDVALEADENSSLFQNIVDKVGKIDESRYSDSNSEYLNGNVPKLFSNLRYTTTTQSSSDGKTTTTKLSVQHKSSNWVASSSLLCGTALGSGLLTLPQAIEAAGYIPTIVATLVAWAYMTISALLTSELLINRCGETGRVRNVGLLELYTSYLGESGGKMAGVGFLLVSYLVMGVYLSEGGDTLRELLEMTVGSSDGIVEVGSSVTTASTMVPSSIGDISRTIVDNPFIPRALFATLMGSFLFAASKIDSVQRTVTHFFLPVTLLGFAAAMTVGLPTADFGALLSLDNQHPELVLSAFPLLFMSWTYHGVMPRVVYDLEGDKDKITKAIVGGSTTALVMYLTWNAVVLGNVLGDGNTLSSTATAASAILNDGSISTIQQSSGVLLRDMLAMQGDDIATASTIGSNPIELLQGQSLQTYVALASELAVVTSLMGVVLGFVNEFYDVIGKLPSQAYGPKEDNKWQVALLTLSPPAIVSVLLGASLGSYDYNFEILDYTGIFGGSVLFLILPALMVWQNRYGEDARPLTVKPMFPLGKITLSSLYKAAGTLIFEQGLEKIGVFEFFKELFESRTSQ
ncbi:tryptophan/tyrosine permease family protein, partial [Skeletonema marinoi]